MYTFLMKKYKKIYEHNYNDLLLFLFSIIPVPIHTKKLYYDYYLKYEL